MPSLYEAVSINHAEVAKALVQLERAINRSIRDNDPSSVEALTKTQLLLISVKAEARLQKILYMSNGLKPSERQAVLDEDTAVKRWIGLIDLAFRKHYGVKATHSLEDKLGHDTLAKRTTILDVVNKDLSMVISLRNKVAHGQWVYPLNSDLTAVEGSALVAMQQENTLLLKYRDNLIHELGSIVTDLVLSGPGFEAQFASHFNKLRDNRRHLGEADYQGWCESLRRTKVRLVRADDDVVAPRDAE